MARRKTPFLPNHYYHVYNRGANKADIFRNDRDYVFLLKQVKIHKKSYGTTCSGIDIKARMRRTLPVDKTR